MQIKAEEWEQQFKSIWDRWSKPIYKYCLHRLNGDETRAEDCTQNTFLTLYQSSDRITDLDHVGAWLYRVANNFVMKEFRRMKKERDQKSYDEPAVENELSYEVDFLEHINEYELYALKEEVLKRLTREDRELLILLFEERRTIHAVAQRLGLSDSAVYKRRTQLVNKVKVIASMLMN